MGNLFYWILAAFIFGILSGGLYTWMSPRRGQFKRLILRSVAAYSAVALGIVYILYVFFD
ncbi:MAG: hypothetical protein NC339_07530 [Muribaculaceae bacterium]|nr:hypothetical protein [Muribaculaceae bacterium]